MMLEKLGLPPKPSGRGRSWVIDASHCQQCASQFSIFNRKHHCRRCGGLFCGNCVQSRMMLRGQGDSPVRICEPCKQAEEAARFEARHGRKKKDEAALEEEERLLKSLLGGEEPLESPGSGVEPVTPESLRQKAQAEKEKSTALRREGRTEEATRAYKRSKELEKQADTLALALRKSSRKASSSSRSSRSEQQTLEVEVITQTVQRSPTAKTKSTGDEDFLNQLKDLGWSDADLNPRQASDAEILRGGASGQSSGKAGALRMEILGHKRRALALKREGKLAEAKEELKLSKALERRVEEIETLGESDGDEDDEGDEMSAVLKALEKEIDRPAKPVALSAESLPLIREDDGDDDAQVDVSEMDMSDPEMLAALKAIGWAEESRVLARPSREEVQARVLAHKRSALALKRAGNLAEARRELSEAKALEKTLDGASGVEVLFEESELRRNQEQLLRFDARVRTKASMSLSDDDGEEEDVMSFVKDLSADPSIAAMLKGLNMEEKSEGAASPSAASAVDAPKTRKRAPRMSPVEELPRRSKRELQQELLGKKRLALSLRREGKEEEAEKVLREANSLELQMKAMEEEGKPQEEEIGDEEIGEEEESDEVTEDDMMDPELLGALSALGFKEEAPQAAKGSVKVKPQQPKPDKDDDMAGFEGEYGEIGQVVDIVPPFFSRLSGSSSPEKKQKLEAPPAPKRAPALDAQQQMPVQGSSPAQAPHRDQAQAPGLSIQGSPSKQPAHQQVLEQPPGPSSTQAPQPPQVRQEQVYVQPKQGSQVLDPSSRSPKLEAPPAPKRAPALDAQQQMPVQGSSPAQAAHRQQAQAPGSSIQGSPSKQPAHQQVLEQPFQARVPGPSSTQAPQAPQVRQEQVHIQPKQLDPSSRSALEQAIQEHKVRALKLKRAGDIAGAMEELRQAKQLEKSQETKVVAMEEKVAKAESSGKFKDRMKLQRESLAHKRKALALRREGKSEEAEAEFELAKSLEKQMEELEGGPQVGAGAGDEGVEDVFDPQLSAALAGLGFQVSGSQAQAQQPQVQQKIVITQAQQLDDSQQQKIKSLKLRALNLKRSGKHEEAIEVLREAKRIEKGII